MTMINVRGSHGAGKTTISRRLIAEHPHEALVEPAFVEGIISSGKRQGEPYRKNFKKPNAFVIEGGVIIVGRWASGMDGMLPHDTIEDCLRYWAPRGHLVWENILVSANIGRWGRLAVELEPINHSIWANLDTPLQLSKDRVMQRRAEARAAGFKHRQTDAEVKVHLHVTHWKRCRKIAAQAAPDFDVRWINHELAYEMVHDQLVRDGWECSVHGLLLPDGPFLTRWKPTAEEIAYVQETTLLPWEQPIQVEMFAAPKLETFPAAIVETNPTPVSTVGTIWKDPYEIGDPFDC